MKVCRNNVSSYRRLCSLSLLSDPVAHSLTLLGTFPDVEDAQSRSPAIIRIEKTALSASLAPTVVTQSLDNVQLMENTDIVRRDYSMLRDPWYSDLCE